MRTVLATIVIAYAMTRANGKKDQSVPVRRLFQSCLNDSKTKAAIRKFTPAHAEAIRNDRSVLRYPA